MSKESRAIVLSVPEFDVLGKTRSEQIRETFLPMSDMLTQFESAYEQVVSNAAVEITDEVTQNAKQLRLKISKIRINVENTRKEQKKQYLVAGKAIDGVSNILKWAVAEKEDVLKKIEKHYELIESKRLEDLQNARRSELSKYVDDAFERDLVNLPDDVWEIYLANEATKYNDKIEALRIAREEQEKKELEERKEQERIRKENVRLKKEAMKREKAEAELRKKLEAERLERERVAKVEAMKREKAEAELRKKLEAERLERERVAKVEAMKREKAEAELRKINEAERLERERVAKVEAMKREKAEAELRKINEEKRRKEEEERRKEEELLARGDAGKIDSLKTDLSNIKTAYKFKSAKNKKMYKDVSGLLDKIINFINK